MLEAARSTSLISTGRYYEKAHSDLAIATESDHIAAIEKELTEDTGIDRLHISF